MVDIFVRVFSNVLHIIVFGTFPMPFVLQIFSVFALRLLTVFVQDIVQPPRYKVPETALSDSLLKERFYTRALSVLIILIVLMYLYLIYLT